jgi:peptide deformylase
VDIQLLGSESLRLCSSDVDGITPEIDALVEQMIDIMLKMKGVGLAAPQVGIPYRVVCMLHDAEPLVLINPVITHAEGVYSSTEGCLSMPGVSATVTRSKQVTVSFIDRQGVSNTMDFEGFSAAIVQHEVDHLDGMMFIDRLHTLTRTRVLKRYRKFMTKVFRQFKSDKSVSL